jgi:surface polysaccharide O-acyltransferase-like enzyme
LAAASALAYVPLAIAFTPWRWADHGPLALQFSRPLLYALYYFLGLVVGAAGLERGLLASGGVLARGWRLWLALAATFLFAWMGLTGLTLSEGASSPLLLQLAADIAFAATCAASLFFAMALALRFGALRSPLLDSLARNAMGIYILHYAPVVWLQYALLGTSLPAVAKAAIVFSAALAASWSATAVLRGIPYCCRLIGEEGRLARRVAP